MSLEACALLLRYDVASQIREARMSSPTRARMRGDILAPLISQSGMCVYRKSRHIGTGTYHLIAGFGIFFILILTCRLLLCALLWRCEASCFSDSRQNVRTLTGQFCAIAEGKETILLCGSGSSTTVGCEASIARMKLTASSCPAQSHYCS